MASLFFSYSHKDEELRNELETHLGLLKRQGIISAWHDRRITAGREFNEAISAELEKAQIILLLISANFLASDYCFEKEMKRALDKHDEKSAVVIPVILHPCDWHSSPFGKLRATPTDGKPVSMFANQHEALAIVAKDIREAAKQFQVAAPTVQPVEALRVSQDVKNADRSSNLRIKRKFDDHEKDAFLEDSYEYITRYFAGSLEELHARNPNIKTRFKRMSESSFAASIYDNGTRVAQCAVWYGTGQGGLGAAGIAFSHSGEEKGNGFNEILSIVDDSYTLQLKPMGMPMFSGVGRENLSQQGAAEYYWSLLIRPLQE